MADIRELGKKIKAKYPGAYDDLDDAELGNKAKAKFPGAYDDFTDAPEPKSISGFGKNVVSSGADFVTGMAKAITSPVQTAKALGAVAHGTAQNKLRKATEVATGQEQPQGSNEPAYEATKKFYSDRFGSLSKALETAYKDPIGTLADVSTIASGTGAALKLVGQAPKLALAGRIGSTLEKVGSATNPIVIPKELAKAALPASRLQTKAGHLYQSALKPPPSWFTPAESEAMIKTGLDSGLTLGLNKTPLKLRGMIDDIDDTVEGAIKDKQMQGATVNPAKVVGATQRSVDKFKNQALPEGDLSTVADAQREFLRSHAGVKFGPDPQTGGVRALNQPTPIPIEKAQQLKRGTYRKLRDPAYHGEQKAASIEVQKDLARGLKEEIYDQLPELRELGQKERSLINLERTIDRFVGREYNKNIMGMQGSLGLTAGSVTGDPMNALMGFIISKGVDHPAVKSRVAIALQRLSKRRSNPINNEIIRSSTAAGRLNDINNQPQ